MKRKLSLKNDRFDWDSNLRPPSPLRRRITLQFCGRLLNNNCEIFKIISFFENSQILNAFWFWSFISFQFNQKNLHNSKTIIVIKKLKFTTESLTSSYFYHKNSWQISFILSVASDNATNENCVTSDSFICRQKQKPKWHTQTGTRVLFEEKISLPKKR